MGKFADNKNLAGSSTESFLKALEDFKASF